MAEKTKKPDRGSQALQNNAYLFDKQALIKLLHRYENEVKGPEDIMPFVERVVEDRSAL
jgi:ADP-glucose pyrophosphorylase